MLAHFTNFGCEGSWGVAWQAHTCFSPNELLLNAITGAKVMGEARWSVMPFERYEAPQVLMPAACPGVVTRTGI